MQTRHKRFLLAAALVAVYLYPFPYFPQIHHANELPRVYLTMAIVDEGTFAIDSGIERWGTTADVSPSGGRHYSNKAPGSSFLAVPAYLGLKGLRSLTGSEPTLGELVWSFRLATGVIPTLLFLLLLWRFLGRFAPSPDTRRLVLVGYALGTMAMTYSLQFMSHQLSAICIGTAWILIVRVVEEGLDERWLLAAGAAAGAAPLVDYQAAFAGVPIAVYFLWHMLRRPEPRVRGVLFAVAGAVPPILLLLGYHWLAFGSPLRTGYHATETFAHFHQRGFLGLDQPRWEALVGSTVAPDNGLLFLSPLLLLALPGLYALSRRRLFWHMGVVGAVIVIYLVFISSLSFWRGGWQVGPRYVTAMLPFALIAVAAGVAWCEQRWPLRALAVGAIGVSVVVYSLSSALYPHFPEKFANPLYELVFRLLADGKAPQNAGFFLGLRGTASLVPYLLLVGGLLVWAAVPSRDRLRSGLVGLAIAGLVLALYSLVPGGGPPADQAYQWIQRSM